MSLKLRLPDGTEIPVRLTAVFRKENNDWKIVLRHLSIGIPNEDVFGNALTTRFSGLASDLKAYQRAEFGMGIVPRVCSILFINCTFSNLDIPFGRPSFFADILPTFFSGTLSTRVYILSIPVYNQIQNVFRNHTRNDTNVSKGTRSHNH